MSHPTQRQIRGAARYPLIDKQYTQQPTTACGLAPTRPQVGPPVRKNEEVGFF